MKTRKTHQILTIILIMQWAFVKLLSQYPQFVEWGYSNGVYSYISKLLRWLLGWIPFSVGDLLYILLTISILRVFYIFFKVKGWPWKALFFNLGAYASVIFFFFHLNWAMNYHRIPFQERLNIDKTSYTNDELMTLTKKLILKSNKIQSSLVSHDSLRPEAPLTKNELKPLAAEAYEKLSLSYPEYSYSKPSVKHSLLSLPLTYMGFAGYLNPFTNEAQVNYLMPTSSYPATLCHEIAHQLGIGSESEANFLGFLACTYSNTDYYNYSGYLMGLRYCLSELYKRDPKNYEIAIQDVNKGIIKEFIESRRFWMSYQNASEKHFKSMYDSYLKANRQHAGIDSYNNMVGLLVNFYKKNQLH